MILKYALVHAALFMAALAAGYGPFCLLRAPTASRLESAVFSATMGLGILSYLVFFLGLCGWLDRLHLGAAWLVLCLVSLAVCCRHPPRLAGLAGWPVLSGWGIALGAGFVILYGLLLVMSLYPPTAFDTTMLQIPRTIFYVTNGSIAPAWHLRQPVLPQAVEMLFCLGYACFGEIAIHLVCLTITLVLALALVAAGARQGSSRIGVWAVALFLSYPLVLLLGTTAYVDAGVGLFTTMAMLALLNWRASRATAWLIAACFFCGVAAGAKHTALVIIAMLSLMVAYDLLRSGRWKSLFGCMALLAVLVAPWYLYCYYYVGNPFWPFFASIFGPGSFTEADLARYMTGFDLPVADKNLWAFLALPWNLVFHDEQFMASARISPWMLLSMPFLIWGGIRIKPLRWVALVSLAFVVFWFLASPQARYLTAVLPGLCLLTSCGLEDIACWVEPRLTPTLRRSLAPALALALVLPGMAWAAKAVWQRGVPPADKAAREKYLARYLPTYDAYQYLNRTQGEHYGLYQLYDENMRLFARGKFMGDWFGPHAYASLACGLDAPTDEILLAGLNKVGADFFLINLDRIEHGLSDAWLSWKHLVPIRANAHYVLFRKLPVSAGLRRSAELLALKPDVLHAGTSVRWVFEEVEVTPDALHLLSLAIASGSTPARVRLILDWRDGQDGGLGADEKGFYIARAWTNYYVLASAPTEARKVRASVEWAGQLEGAAGEALLWRLEKEEPMAKNVATK